MASYVHHTPGRLRVRAAGLKGRSPQAAAARDALLDLAGVRTVDVTPATGSVLIAYCPRTISGEAILGTMKGAGIITRLPRETTAAGRLGEIAGQMAAEYLIGQLIERAGAGLLLAVL